jgi:hypothetical protein
MNFRHGVLRFPVSGLFVGRANLGTGHCPVHTRQSSAPQAGAILIRPIFKEATQGSIFLIDVYGLYAPEKRSTRQTS